MRGFTPIAGQQQGVQRERRVAHPAIAVVPVARTADPFGKRGGRRGDDPPGRCVDEALERDARAHHGVAPAAVVRALRAPCIPLVLHHVEHRKWIDGQWPRLVRWKERDHERHALAACHREIRDRAEILAVRIDARTHLRRERTGRGEQRPVHAAHPRNHTAVAEAQHELHAHRHPATQPRHDAHDIRALVPRRHEVGDADRAGGRLELRFQDQRAVAIPSRCPAHRPRGRQQPATLLRRAQQRAEARGVVEARHAEPVDRAVAAHERGGAQIADRRVVLDGQRQGTSRRTMEEATVQISCRTWGSVSGWLNPNTQHAEMSECFSLTSAPQARSAWCRLPKLMKILHGWLDTGRSPSRAGRVTARMPDCIAQSVTLLP